MLTVCQNLEECCRELARVWEALGVTSYTGKSASEHVKELLKPAAAQPPPPPPAEGTTPVLTWRYVGEELAVFWMNPWEKREEKIASFWWLVHPVEMTEAVELVFEELASRMCASPAEPTRETPLPLSTLEQAIRETWTDELEERIFAATWTLQMELAPAFGSTDEMKEEAAKQCRALELRMRAEALSPLLAPRTAGGTATVPLTDSMILQMLGEADAAVRRAGQDARAIGCTPQQVYEIERDARCETVRSYLYQAGVVPAPPAGASERQP